MDGSGCAMALIISAVVMGLFALFVFTSDPVPRKRMSAIEWDSSASRIAEA
jgi:Na+-driven multidrug efflux pump